MSQLPTTVAGLKVNEARDRAIGALDDASSNHVGLIHTARLLSLIDKRLNRVPLTTTESQQWQAALGFAEGVLQANDDLARFAVSPVGTLRIGPDLFTRQSAAPGTYRLGIEQATLDAAIADEASARASAVAAEAASRAGADSALNGAITSEASARAGADTALNAALSAEATARANADTAEVSARNSAIASALTWTRNTVSRSFTTAYQPHASKHTLVVATIKIACGAGEDGQIVLYTDSSSSPIASGNWRGVLSTNANNTVIGSLSAIVPPGHYYALNRETTSGSPSYSFPINVQEYFIGP